MKLEIEMLALARFIIEQDSEFRELYERVAVYNRERLCIEEVQIRGLEYCDALSHSNQEMISAELIVELTRLRKFVTKLHMNKEESRQRLFEKYKANTAKSDGRSVLCKDRIQFLDHDEVFVFGGNVMGLHGAGAAKTAMQWGAKWGVGVGYQGQTYAIPTMDGSTEAIKPYIDEFIDYAAQNPSLKFLVTEIGCEIAGYTAQQIAPFFEKAITIENIYLPQSFWDVIFQKSFLFSSDT